jgi:quinone-modifying oxidoreductase, subunit QmoA
MLPILVIGGGISGVTSAVELAEAGRDVILLERDSHLGGNVVKLHNYFPKLCPPACGMEINFRRLIHNSRIRIMTHTEVKSIHGPRGNMQVEVVTAPQMVNDRCTSCGDCITVCPEERPDSFNYNLGATRAIYLPQPLAFPRKYEIDAAACKGPSCNKCVEACSYEAIDLQATAQQETLAVHSVIAATGWKSYDAAGIAGLAYNQSPDIVTNVEFERLLSVTGPNGGSLRRPSDNTAPGSIAFVQCAGSRDRNYLPYCSAVCCSASLKHALNVSELLPETKVTIFYIDLRVSGRNEDFLNRVERTKSIQLVKGKVARVEVVEKAGERTLKAGKQTVEADKQAVEADKQAVKQGEMAVKAGNLMVEAEDIASGRKVNEAFDMVVLATGIVPANGVPGMQVNEEGFYSATQDDGIVAAACVKKPMDVSASVKDATAAAIKAMR